MKALQRPARYSITVSLALLLLTGAWCLPAHASPELPRPDTPELPENGIRQIVTAIAQAAKKNTARPPKERLRGDALADLYIQQACKTGLPARTIVLGLAYALEPSASIASTPFTSEAFVNLETAAERRRRWATMGNPTMRGRKDWLSHFVVSAGLTVALGESVSEYLGTQKEVSDAQGKEKGDGSGFSFADLNANYAGNAFARWLTGAESKKAVTTAAHGFRGADFLPDPVGLVEELTWAEFQKRFGSLSDSRFRDECERIRKRVQECKAYASGGR